MKSIEQANQDIAVFMYGLQWWKNEKLKTEIFIMKKYEKFENLKPVWQKMSDNYKGSGRLFTEEKSVSEIFQDVVSDMYQHSYGHDTIEKQLMVTTSESLKKLT